MAIADPQTYLEHLVELMNRKWPDNRRINIVCHGHSVPAGYFATPYVDSMNAYPHLLHGRLKERFPFAVVNVIVTAVGGEHAQSGAMRFESEVLCHRPDVVVIDYGLNDRGIGLQAAAEAWRTMIRLAQAHDVKVLLLTPTWDESLLAQGEEGGSLRRHAQQIRKLAAECEVGLADSFAAFEAYCKAGGDLRDLLSWPNHPNREGHDIVADGMLRWFGG